MAYYAYVENMFDFEGLIAGEGGAVMWGTEERIGTKRAVLADGGYAGIIAGKNRGRKFSRSMAMFLGVLVTIEIMIAGAMVFNFDFHGADVIALVLAFMVLYSGVVAVLTDK